MSPDLKRLNVLYLRLPAADPLWQDEIIKAVSPRHNLAIYDPGKPLAPQFQGVEAVLDVGGSVGTREMYQAATETKLWQILGTGLDHIDLALMKTFGFAIAYCPGQFSSVGLAECAMMYILMLARRVRECEANFKAGILYKPTSMELEEKVLGIIGFGSSGQELARRARGFGMRIHAVDVRPIEPAILEELHPEFLGSPDDLDRVVQESDFLSLHLHLNAENPPYYGRSQNLPYEAVSLPDQRRPRGAGRRSSLVRGAAEQPAWRRGARRVCPGTAQPDVTGLPAAQRSSHSPHLGRDRRYGAQARGRSGGKSRPARPGGRSSVPGGSVSSECCEKFQEKYDLSEKYISIQ